MTLLPRCRRLTADTKAPLLSVGSGRGQQGLPFTSHLHHLQPYGQSGRCPCLGGPSGLCHPSLTASAPCEGPSRPARHCDTSSALEFMTELPANTHQMKRTRGCSATGRGNSRTALTPPHRREVFLHCLCLRCLLLPPLLQGSSSLPEFRWFPFWVPPSSGPAPWWSSVEVTCQTQALVTGQTCITGLLEVESPFSIDTSQPVPGRFCQRIRMSFLSWRGNSFMTGE